MFGGTIDNSVGLGKVHGKANVGGLVGSAGGPAVISNSVKRGEQIQAYVNFNRVAAGGILGYGGASVTLTDVVSRESIISKDFVSGDFVGGLVGQFGGTLDGGEVSSRTFLYGGEGTGGAIGYLSGGSLNNVRVQSTVEVNNRSISSGGLVGLASGSFSIENSYSLADVEGYNSSFNGPQENVGGLIGEVSSQYSFSAQISNSFAAGEIIEGSEGSGGLLGNMDAVSGMLTITDSYAALPINSTANNTGGLVGRVEAGLLNVTTSYWDTEVTTENTTAEDAGTGLKTAQFMDPDNLSGFDFDNVWGYNSTESSSYPWLRWTNDTAGYWSAQLGYTVSFDRNGGTGGTLPDPETITSGNSFSVPTSDVGIQKTGESFQGWALSDSATSADSSITMDADKVLYAVWSADSYTLTLDNDGSTTTQSVEYNTNPTVTNPSKPFNTFVGWSDQDDNVAEYAKDLSDYTMPASNDTLFAVWSVDSFTLTLDNEGSTTTQSVEYNTNPTDPGLRKTGFTLDGWSDQDDNVAEYAKDLSDYTMPGSNDTLFAVWIEVTSSSPSPTPYSGPVITSVDQTPESDFSSQGQQTTVIFGERLSGVTKVVIDEKQAEILKIETTMVEIILPPSLPVGTYDIEIFSSLGNLTYVGAIKITESLNTEDSQSYGQVSAWTKRISDEQLKVYVKFPTVGEKVRIGHQSAGQGSYETVYVKTTSSETMDGLRIVEGVGTYVVRTIQLEEINRIRVSVGANRLVQIRYNR
jgi:hypothetical protein